MKSKTISVIVVLQRHLVWSEREQKYVNEIPGVLSLAEIQKIVLKSTAHILRRTLSL